MRKITWILLALWMAGRASAEEANWLTSLPLAETLARRENKLVLIDFTGSDWCGWCMKLDSETFSQPEFIQFASQNLELMRADFPRNKPQPGNLRSANRGLKSTYDVEGFPTVVVVKPDGTVLWRQSGYAPGGPKVMIDAVNECRKAVGLAAPMASPALVAAPVAAAPAPQPAPLPPKPTDDLKVQAILYAPGHSAAVLDGKTCEEGDTVHGRRVVKIARDTVTVEFQGQTKILSMN